MFSTYFVRLTCIACLAVMSASHFVYADDDFVPSIMRKDHFIAGTKPCTYVHIREVKGIYGSRADLPLYPLVLLHGGAAGGIACFDLTENGINARGGSLAEDLARQGVHVFIVNLRCFEQSSCSHYDTNDKEMGAVSLREAYEDLSMAQRWIRKYTNSRKTSLLGWATGGHWAGYYASKQSKRLAHFISVNALYSVNAPWIYKKAFALNGDTATYNDQAQPLFMIRDKDALIRNWMNSLPEQDPSTSVDTAVVRSYQRAAMNTVINGTPYMKAPTGSLRESFYQSNGKRYWEAKDIRVPILLIRGGRDFWSRPVDNTTFQYEAKNAPSVMSVTINEATHFPFFARPERGRTEFIKRIVEFLSAKR
jgi:pimeloyl-ACP methyl ester carboxylesterase